MGKSFGDWQITSSLGEGGQGYTYIVTRPPDAELFALKRLKNKNRVGRFRNEIEAGLALSHPNVLRIVDHCLQDGAEPWVVSEYCSIGTLSQISAGARPIDEVLLLFQQICSGVAAAHAKGIVHRDLKPDNILLRSNGSIAVADFGLCYFLDEDERVTFTEEAVGPRWYMAPELEDGRAEHITPRSDVYSLGKVLYRMLAGRIFSREKHRDPQYYLAKDSRNSVDYLVYELLDRTIVAEPSQRIANAAELGQEVATLRRRVATGAHAIGKSVPQPCSYCGLGMYRVIADKERPMSVRNFGFELVGNPDWIIMACDYCANIQIFRPDANRRGAMRAKNEPWEK